MLIIRAFLALGLSAIFLVSAVSKMLHFRSFMLAVIEYRILPFRISKLFALLLPPLELLIALLLLTGTFVRFAALVYALLMLSFAVAVSVNLVRGRDLNCACFGSNQKRKISGGLVTQDMLLCLSALLLAILTPSWWASEPWAFMQYTGMVPWSILVLLVAFSITLSAVLRRNTRIIPGRGMLLSSLRRLFLRRVHAS